MDKIEFVGLTEIRITGRNLDYKEFLQYGNEFIETGSGGGDGIQRALDAGFEKVSSIEAKDTLFQLCKERFKDVPQVKMYYGRTEEILPLVIHVSKKPVIFLDAHVSGEASAGHDDWLANGSASEFAQDTIIKKEIDIIFSRKNWSEDAIGFRPAIIIDDINGLADGHAVEYCEKILGYMPNYKFFFFDENLSGQSEHYYKDKILVAIPI